MEKSPKQPASHWLSQTWGALYLDPNQELPEKWSKGTHQKFTFICGVLGCDRRKDIIFNNITSGRYTTCGNCSSRLASYWKEQQWGALHLDPKQEFPPEWGTSSLLKFKAICDGCGKTTVSMSFKDLILAKSCGKCTWQSKSHWLSQKWEELQLVPDQHLPGYIAPSSNKPFSFSCTCGRLPSMLPFYKVTSGRQTTCGHCSDRPKEFWVEQKWNSLRLAPNQGLKSEWASNSSDDFEFVCDCTRSAKIKFYSVSRGHTKTCGKCNFRPREFWLAQKWGNLRLDPERGLPDEWSPGTETVFDFLCNCGRSANTPFCKVTNGHTTSCGKCSWKSRDHWLAQTWGDLRLDPNQELPDEWGKGSDRQVRVLCSCGRNLEMWFYALTLRNRECGNCSSLPKEHWISQTGGSLTLAGEQELPDEWQPFSTQKLLFNCTKCSKQISVQFNYVYHGDYLSCGSCNRLSKQIWLSKRWGRLRIDPNQEMPDEFVPSGTRLNFICECDELRTNVISGVLDNVISGNTKSCGCLKIGENEFSPENEVRQFAASLDPDTHPKSYDIENSRMKYDVYIKPRKFAVEYHGLHWHSERLKDEKEAKLIEQGLLKNRTPPAMKDRKKYELACSRGDLLIQIYADEWATKQPIMMGMIQDRLAPEKRIRIKPSFEVRIGKTPKEALSFLERNHYLGKAGGRLTIIARHNGAVIGVWVFKKKDGDIMWHRACWDQAYKTWNPHEKALKMALPLLKDMGFTRMVTFSDNRFHTGALYEKLGFTFEEEIAPEYSYTNEIMRKSKFAFRVPAGVNEEEAARVKGWYRIYDSGKKRYSLPVL